MFDNISGKLKSLAEVLCRMGIGASVIGGIVVILISEGKLIFPGILIAIFGSLFSWFGNFFVYGFGELIDKVDAIEKYMARDHATKD